MLRESDLIHFFILTQVQILISSLIFITSSLTGSVCKWNIKVSGSESVRICKCPNIWKCLNLKVSESESVQIWKCPKLKISKSKIVNVSESECIKIRMSQYLKVSEVLKIWQCLNCSKFISSIISDMTQNTR